ncbi:MAG TPA: large conductance mechanosensitive channel protein MscL [Mycobacteriales bacterium]|nr:large conductance mechanosensitive channel protein MscL [Mycobacteriales bacterium]
MDRKLFLGAYLLEGNMSGFRKFLLRGNLVDLAVAVVIGAAFGALVTKLVADFITPLLAAIGGKPDFSALSFTVNKSHFLYGDFINAVISFVILAAVIYFLVVKPFSALLERFKPAPDEPAPLKECAECLSSIPAAARKCAFCASPQAA